ncbi:hypothetical protein BJ508DRAFT_336698 [Ascobolus immersus RN42]|uniref:Uncharacterized protein n=1 Tax=Ascobolus immersus RN42 TaxID=1160509 RepID=A0A3N4H7M7_ASCIM|nr:hypothetical protein BJ508DRAFT_336698 [Ascobolus immersus RN42]
MKGTDEPTKAPAPAPMPASPKSTESTAIATTASSPDKPFEPTLPEAIELKEILDSKLPNDFLTTTCLKEQRKMLRDYLYGFTSCEMRDDLVKYAELLQVVEEELGRRRA